MVYIAVYAVFVYVVLVSNLDQLYGLVSSALPTTRRDMTCTVLKVT